VPRSNHRVVFSFAVLILGVVLAACGGSPNGPSESNGIVLRGQATGLAAVASTRGASAMSAASAASGDVTVTVQENPAITTKVGADGTFTLRGLPEGSFTLVFKDAGGAVLGTITLGEVKPNQEITITVDFSSGTVRLVEDRRNGIGHGDIEVEGKVSSVVGVNPAADSTFVISGYTVIARPGVTAIREGNRARTVQDVTTGRQVHVKGEWLPTGTGSSQPVLAHEIKLQGGGDDGDGGEEKITICHKKKETITISISAWPAHQAHGDTKGACTK
jgi:hypothetical protein